MSRKSLVPIVLPADPAQPMEATTKQYVDGITTQEVFIGTSDPGAPYELWYDTDEEPAAPVWIWEPGDLKLTARATPSTGWLGPCTGQAVSRSTYPDLFIAIGVTYGVGDGSTTFNLPNISGRALIAAGAGSGLTARALGAAGGVENETAPLPVHNHTDAGHQHTVSGNNIIIASAGGIQAFHDPASLFAIAPAAPFLTFSGAANIQNAGTGGTHNNMPPYWAGNVFIKT